MPITRSLPIQLHGRRAHPPTPRSQRIGPRAAGPVGTRGQELFEEFVKRRSTAWGMARSGTRLAKPRRARRGPTWRHSANRGRVMGGFTPGRAPAAGLRTAAWGPRGVRPPRGPTVGANPTACVAASRVSKLRNTPAPLRRSLDRSRFLRRPICRPPGLVTSRPCPPVASILARQARNYGSEKARSHSLERPRPLRRRRPWERLPAAPTLLSRGSCRPAGSPCWSGPCRRRSRCQSARRCCAWTSNGPAGSPRAAAGPAPTP